MRRLLDYNHKDFSTEDMTPAKNCNLQLDLKHLDNIDLDLNRFDCNKK